MSINKSFITYLLIFIVLSILLKTFGIIEFETIEILGYAFIFYGIATVYLSFGKEKKSALFLGTTIFMVGVVMLILGSFDFPRPINLIIPSFLFIIGAGFLILFIDDLSNSILFSVALVFILLGIAAAIVIGSVDFSSFIGTVWIVTKRYWMILVVIIGIILLLWRD